MENGAFKKAIAEHGQYRDVSYIGKDGKAVGTRCLVVPARIVEPLLKRGKNI